jgi:hypothetical protein
MARKNKKREREIDPAAAEIAIGWIEKWSGPKPATTETDNDLDWVLPRSNPRLCLDAILEVLARIPADAANHHFQVLAAGPLEGLLVHHGRAFVDEVEILARRSPEFRLLLNGTWHSQMEKDVVERLRKYRASGW